LLLLLARKQNRRKKKTKIFFHSQNGRRCMQIDRVVVVVVDVNFSLALCSSCSANFAVDTLGKRCSMIATAAAAAAAAAATTQ